MSYNLRLAIEAQAEETDAYNYYEGIRAGLGDDLLSELEKCYAKIAEHPLYYCYLENSTILRHTRIARFPYIVIYIVSKDDIIISLNKKYFKTTFYLRLTTEHKHLS